MSKHWGVSDKPEPYATRQDLKRAVWGFLTALGLGCLLWWGIIAGAACLVRG